MKESDILRACMIEASKLGATVWRNNTGVLQDRNGRPVKFGLCVGSSDIIGMYKGKFIAIECKAKTGRLSQKQMKFLQLVEDNGGHSIVARCADDVKNFLTNIL